MKRIAHLTGKKSGFTVIELLAVIGIIAVIIGILGFGLIGSIIMGNQWFTDQGVLNAIRVEHPEAKSILATTRNVYSESKIVVENQGGTKSTYYLDSDLLFNYRISTLR